MRSYFKLIGMDASYINNKFAFFIYMLQIKKTINFINVGLKILLKKVDLEPQQYKIKYDA